MGMLLIVIRMREDILCVILSQNMMIIKSQSMIIMVIIIGKRLHVQLNGKWKKHQNQRGIKKKRRRDQLGKKDQKTPRPTWAKTPKPTKEKKTPKPTKEDK